MQEPQKANRNSDESRNNQLITPSLANLSAKTAIISFSVSVATQPFQAKLNRMQFPSAVSSGLFRSMYRGFLPHAIAGQQRGVVTVTAKQTNSNREVANEGSGEKELPVKQRWLGTFLFSQADLLLANALNSKSKMESTGIIPKTNFKWFLTHYLKLTSLTWGSRSIAGFINFAAIGFVGDYISSFYKFNNDFYNKLLGGATAGAITTFFTTIPNSYADKKILASKMENGRLLTTTSFSMFQSIKSHVTNTGVKEALLTFIKVNYLKESLVRCPQAALTFSIIFGLDNLIGPEPLKKIWPGKIEDIDSEKLNTP
ncbi:hypothetical protein [Legionella fairfieldensis]|uniref:hypothetical protein n=1 Tax=Legionella fairfieldensis TaxID=45064 RepID=UPI00048DE43F|nr:hypothetical protein [Legionella fairfieldensis]